MDDFLIGSSYFVTIFPFLYIGLPYKSGKKIPGVSFTDIVLILPLYYGIMNVIVKRFLEEFAPPSSRNVKLFLRGAIIGFLLSLVGHFMFNVPKHLFALKGSPYMVHLYAPILYGLIFMIVVGYLEK